MSLFRTTQDLRERLPAKLTLRFEDLRPTLDEAEQEYLAEKVLGPTLYGLLHGAVQGSANDSELDDDELELIDLCRRVSAPLGVYHYTGLGNVELTSGGLAVGQTDNLRPASEWRTRDFERSVLRQGFRAMDVLIAWLLEHTEEWEEWQESALYRELSTGLLRTTQQYDAHVRIGNSGWLFHQLLPAVRRAEQGPVADTLCSASYLATLQEKITAGTLTANEALVVQHARAAAAHLAMAESIVQLSLGTDERGVWTFGALLGGQTSGGVTPAKDQRLQARIDQERSLGHSYLERLRAELQRQAEADATHPYRSSPCYRDPDADTGPQVDDSNPVGNFL